MAKIDIRYYNNDKITQIEFDDPDQHDAYMIEKPAGSYVKIHSVDEYILVRAGAVENLIKALQKAVELGWTK
jgi:hypothetical protein